MDLQQSMGATLSGKSSLAWLADPSGKLTSGIRCFSGSSLLRQLEDTPDSFPGQLQGLCVGMSPRALRRPYRRGLGKGLVHRLDRRDTRRNILIIVETSPVSR